MQGRQHVAATGTKAVHVEHLLAAYFLVTSRDLLAVGAPVQVRMAPLGHEAGTSWLLGRHWL